MSKNKSKKDSRPEKSDKIKMSAPSPMNPRIKRTILAIILLVIAIILILGAFGVAGVAGNFLYTDIFQYLFGWGVVLIPVFLVLYSLHLFKSDPVIWHPIEYVSAVTLLLSILGFIQIVSPVLHGGGVVGHGIGNLTQRIFDVYAGAIILGAIALVSILVLLNEELGIPGFLKELFKKQALVGEEGEESTTIRFTAEELAEADGVPPFPLGRGAGGEGLQTEQNPSLTLPKGEGTKHDEDDFIGVPAAFSESYEYPPLSLLSKSAGKAAVGDIKAHANLIKRTLMNFGMDVEMDEVSIGPTVTRYALKPAEGIKLSRITALKSDLALALAAHPIRIEAPIPGKSLVGIEIPNRSKSLVGLGSLLEEDIFQNSPHRLYVALGKGVTGKSYFANLGKMPHLLVAGTTGAGKSVTIHNLILSLVYRNGPEDLRFIMVDPKRVELTLYNDIPHLLTPVIKEPKKAIMALKWAAKEMERRYDILEKSSCRDITSYREKVESGKLKVGSDGSTPARMPYIVIIIDELADIMSAYPRELEAAIVRLAQMSRAVGIHLILSTQRPSVNVITGLIKANIPSRLALQVASQIDSRTILDAPGAESLLGKGDMLYQGEGMSKPERMQCANVEEDEVKKVVQFIKRHNEGLPDEIVLGEALGSDDALSSMSFSGSDSDDDDELYEDARATVMEAGKASTSYIQRKLKVGYSRAARLIDLLEERGVVGPADGAKPREVIGGGSNNDLSPVAEPISEDSKNTI